MALPDPIPTITVNSVAYDLARIGMENSKAVYQTASGNDRLTVASTVNRNRSRTVVRLDRKKFAADPLNSALTRPYTLATYVVSDSDNIGWTAAEKDYHQQLLAALWVAGTPDYGLRILQGEV